MNKMLRLLKKTFLPLFLVFTISGNLFAQANDDCLACHDDASLTADRGGRTVSMYVNPSVIGKSVHKKLNCIACHLDANVSEFPHPDKLAPVNCGSCHKNPQMQFNSGIHGKAFNAKDTHAPSCKECHGNHDIINHTDPKSRTYKMNIPVLCGTCHREGAPVGRLYKITEHNIIENYSQGTHGVGLFKKGLTVTATCNDCHGNHMILPSKDKKSSVAPNNVAATCMKCHARIEDVHKKVIKNELWEPKRGQIPSCSECHPTHLVKVTSILADVSDKSCVSCHIDGDAYRTKGGKKVSLKMHREDYMNSSHKKISCTKCHTQVNLNAKRPCEKTVKVDCSGCHKEVSELYFNSGHGQAYMNKNANSPYCTDCHGTHTIKSKADSSSITYRGAVPQLCGKCHTKNGKATEKTLLKEVDAFSDYSSSIHGRGLKNKGLLSSAICTDCHTSHDIQRDTVPTSSIHRNNISKTCGECHKSIYTDYIQSDHSIFNDKGTLKYPTCLDCHSSHTITEIDKDKFMNEVTKQCGKCHEDLSKSYLETYHGKAYQLGYMKTARCSDCHGSHRILKVSNPNSEVSQTNIVRTCANCHPNSNAQFAGYLTHATHDDKPILSIVFWAMTSLLIGVFVVFGIHTLLWFPRSLKERKKKVHTKITGKSKYYRRFTPAQRFTHILVIVSFLLLAFTGMLLKFAHMAWAEFFMDLLGGVKFAGNLHRFGAIITFFYFGFHLYTLYKHKKARNLTFKELIFGRQSLMFNLQDLHDLRNTLKWFTGKGERPQYGRWTYWEKFDYMAVFWGVAVIGFSGLILWFPVFFTQIFPGWVINIAMIIHSDEALLAVGFIFTIHFFNTHLRAEAFPMDTVIFTGHVPIDEYAADRPLEMQQLEEDGKLDSVIVEKEINPSWMKLIKVFGYTALWSGIIIILLIIYSLIFGKY